MNSRRPFVLLIVAAAFAASSFAQSSITGKVVEVIDGKTVVIDADGRRLTAEIQYIEVPEPEQELHTIVREHLAKLTLAKTAEFRARGFSPGRAFGQLYVGSVDVAVQMLRDGAAWHIPAEKTGQAAAESSAYQYHQNQARSEKRGVWGMANMKPAWEFRADKIERARQAQIAAELISTRVSETSSESVPVKAAVKRTGGWSDVNPYLKNPGPLVHGYNAATRTGYVGTSLMGVKELEGQPPGQKTAVDITYLYKQEDKARKGTFIVSVLSAADDWRFLKENNLTVIVDEKKYPIGKPKRTTAREDGKLVEKLTYELTRPTIEKLVYGGEVYVQIGTYMLYPTPGLQLLLYNMLLVSE